MGIYASPDNWRTCLFDRRFDGVVAAGQSISVRMSGVSHVVQHTCDRLTSGARGMRVGKGKGYSHACAASAMPATLTRGLFSPQNALKPFGGRAVRSDVLAGFKGLAPGKWKGGREMKGEV